MFCALFPRLCANAPTLADALELLRARAGAPARPSPASAIPRDERPDLSKLPDDPGVYIFRDLRGRPLYVGKSVSLRSRARAHFCAPAGWTERAEIVDYKPTNSELGALVLENRLIKQWQPPGNARAQAHRRAACTCAAGSTSRTRCSRWPPSRRPGTRSTSARCAASALAEELADQLSSLFGLRHCGRAS